MTLFLHDGEAEIPHHRGLVILHPADPERRAILAPSIATGRRFIAWFHEDRVTLRARAQDFSSSGSIAKLAEISGDPRWLEGAAFLTDEGHPFSAPMRSCQDLAAATLDPRSKGGES